MAKKSPGSISAPSTTKRNGKGKRYKAIAPQKAPITYESGRVILKRLMRLLSIPRVCLKK